MAETITWDWDKFIKVTAERKPNSLVIRAIERLSDHCGLALDLGCGAGIESKFLAERGFEVEAVDSSSVSIQQTRLSCQRLPVKIFEQDLTHYIIRPQSYRIIVAWNSLSFLVKDRAQEVLLAIQSGLILHGQCVVGLLGTEDAWAKQSYSMSFWTTDELKAIWPSLRLIELLEEKEFGATSKGKKKLWHRIGCLAERQSL